jgi:thiamine pyrophosphate-dependent acetolactate synthase large subunit-like protein
LPPVSPVRLGPGPSEAIEEAARLLGKAERPVLLLSMLARDLLPLFAGRVGLFHDVS